MGINVTAEVGIKRSRDDVAAYATNPDNDTQWIGGIREAKMLTDGPVGQGTQVERVASFMGKRIQYILEVTDFAPGERMAMRSIKGPFPMQVSYEFEESSDGCLARIQVRGDSSGFFKIASPVLAQGVKKNIGKDLKNLKAIMEAATK